MGQDDINREEQANPANWGDGPWGFYFSKRDSRLWVPKRGEPTSWTFNFGHRNAAPWLMVFMLFQALMMAVTSFIAVSQGVGGVPGFIGVVSGPLMLNFLLWMVIATGRVAPRKDRGKDE